jgi:hypothetical protein
MYGCRIFVWQTRHVVTTFIDLVLTLAFLPGTSGVRQFGQ